MCKAKKGKALNLPFSCLPELSASAISLLADNTTFFIKLQYDESFSSR